MYLRILRHQKRLYVCEIVCTTLSLQVLNDSVEHLLTVGRNLKVPQPVLPARLSQMGADGFETLDFF